MTTPRSSDVSEDHPSGPREDLQRLEGGTTTAAALAFFDSLAPTTVTGMLGRWSGSELPTGHPLDGLLGPMRWHGKTFRAPDDVDPLVMDGPRGRYALDPRFVPVSLLPHLRPVLRVAALRAAARATLPILRTSRPTARLRMVEYRGVTTATMTYDTLPIHDHFREVDANTVLGAMDLRGQDRPYLFVLRREAAATRPGGGAATERRNG